MVRGNLRSLTITHQMTVHEELGRCLSGAETPGQVGDGAPNSLRSTTESLVP